MNKKVKVCYDCILTNKLVTYDGINILYEPLDKRDLKNYNHYHLLKGYKMTEEGLKQFYNDFTKWCDEIKDVVDYSKYFDHNQAVKLFFQSKSTIATKNHIDNLENITFLESGYLESVKKCGLMTYNKEYMNKEFINYGYDFSSYYAFLLGSNYKNFDISAKSKEKEYYFNFEFPFKVGKQDKITNFKKQLKYGIYDVEVKSYDEKLLTVFMINKSNRYTHYEINFLLKYKKVFTIELEILNQDKEYNCLVYDDTIESQKIFGCWFNTLYKLKLQFPKNKLLKHLLSTLHGSLSQYKRITVKGSEIEQYENKISYFHDEDETQYKILNVFNINDQFQYHIVDIDEIYTTNFARLKPFLTSYGRVQMAKFVMNNDLLNDTVRIHTDGIVLTKELDFETLKSNYQPKIEDKYHLKNIVWFNCIYNSENKDKDINEENE